MKSSGRIERRFDALPAAVAFVERALDVSSLDNERRQTVHLAVEELLTNMLKYAPQGAPTIAIEIACHQGAVDVTLIDSGVERFDPTRAPDPGIDRPIDERRPGGLGLHLVARLVDSLSYDYAAERREGTTRFRVEQPREC